MKTLISFISLAILLAITTFGSVQAEPTRAWGWFDKPFDNAFVLNAAFQFNSKGGALTGKRTAKGVYQVTIPNMSNSYYGVCHAVAHNGNHSAQVVSWNPVGNNVVANIRVFNSSGNPTDGRFVILFYKEDNKRGAYTWVSGTGNVTHNYQCNSAGQGIQVNKSGAGRYTVNFKGIKPANFTNKRGTVIVTPYSSSPRRARVINWGVSVNGDAKVNVQITDSSGNPTDSRFVISYINDFNIGQRSNSESADYGAFVWASNASAAAAYTPSAMYSDNNASNTIKVKRLARGSYKVTLGGVKNNNSTTAIATAYGATNAYASVDKWYKNPTDGTDVYVKTYDANGNPKDSQFTLFYYTNQNILY